VNHVLHNDRVRASVDPRRGARLISLSIDGHELLAEGGCFPMIPWAGRIRDGTFTVDGVTYDLPLDKDGNAIHGLGRNVEWEMTAPGTFQRVLGAPWPTEGTAQLHYELLDDGLRTTLSWDDGTEVPCSMGLHPWFRRRLDSGDDVVLTFDPEVMVEREGRLPTGRLIEPRPGPWDDCFRVPTSPVLTWPGQLAVSLSSSSPWWVVYDEPAETVCVEPQTAPPDAFEHPALQPDGAWPRSLWFDVRARA
jgi:aldose 1-epimerase